MKQNLARIMGRILGSAMILALLSIGAWPQIGVFSNVYAQATKTFTNDHSGSLGWYFTPSGIGYYHEVGNTGPDGVAYCMDQHKEGPDDMTYTKGSAPDQILSYILKHGYPSTNTIQGHDLTDGEARAVTQLAIWFHREGTNMEGYDIDNEPFNIARSLYKAAKSYDGPAFTYGSIWNPSDNSRQHILLAATPTGTVTLTKASADNAITKGNGAYSLSGAVYGVYKTKAEAQAAGPGEQGDPVGKLTTDAQGKTNTLTLEEGTYYLKELKTPKGYALNTTVYTAVVEAGEKTTVTAKDSAQYTTLSILLQKVDGETGMPRPQGAASLKDAEYTVKYYDSYSPGDSPETSDEAKATWTFRTDENGRIDFNSQVAFVGGDDRIRIGSDYVLPLGTVTIEETTPSEGYKKDPETYVLTLDGAANSAETDLKIIKEPVESRELVKRGDLSGIKIFDSTNKRGVFIPFKLTSRTTGESHTFTTDENGEFSTVSTWNSHDSEEGVWFGGYGEEEGAPVDEEKGALPYDTYILDELPCEANQGYELLTGIEVIISKERTVLMGTLTNDTSMTPKIGTTAADSSSGNHEGNWEQETVTIIDTVKYEDLLPGEYTMKGVLMDRGSGETILDQDEEPVTAEKTFTVPTRGKGTMKMEFSVAGEVLKGRETVVFETVYLDETPIAEHADLENDDQTVVFPEKPVPPKKPSKHVPKTGDEAFPVLAVAGLLIATITVFMTRKTGRNE